MAITQVSNSLVKQDLTIVGGTVDNTVIGSGTPAAGTFTTVAGSLASTVTGTTAAASDNSTKIATTAYVTTALANLVDSAPGTLNTLNELAAALGDDASFSTTVTSSIAAKLPLAGGTITGVIQPNSANSIDLGANGNEFRTLYVDTSIIASNPLTIATGTDFTVDAGGDIILDADSGVWRFKDAGTTVFQVARDGNSFLNLFSAVSDMDMRFQGNDGGSAVTALTLDMSAAGEATFNAGITAETGLNLESGTLVIKNATGDSSGLKIFQDSSDASKIYNNFNGTLELGVGNTTALTIDSSEKTTFSGDVNVFGTNRKLAIGESGSGGTFGFLGWNDASNYLYLGNSYNSAFNTDIVIDASGNVGVGVTPDTFSSGYTAIQINGYAYNIGHSGGDHYLTNNAYFNSGWKYGQTSTAQLIQMASGKITLFTAASGSADAAITWNTGLVQDASGNVGIGETSPLGKLHVKEGDSGVSSANANFDQLILEDDQHSGMSILSGASYHGGIYFADPTTNDVGQIKYFHNDDSLHFTVNSQERLVVESDGNTRVKTGNIVIDGAGKGIFIGGTGSANKLEDFEEGTWAPSFYAGGLTVTQVNFAKYTKVNNFVQIVCYVSIGGTPNGANLTLAGLPFTVATNAFGVGTSDMEYQPVGTYIRAQSSTTQAVFLKAEGTSTGRSVLGGTNFQAGYGIFNFSYYTS